METEELSKFHLAWLSQTIPFQANEYNYIYDKKI